MLRLQMPQMHPKEYNLGGHIHRFHLHFRQAKGFRWVGVAHVVKDHPIFEGLPSNGLMGQTYENVWAMKTLTGLNTQPIVGAVTHDFYPMKRNIPDYLGPEPAWWGTDLGVVQQGQGRFILSSLRLVDNLGKDPVADRILFNLIEYAASAVKGMNDD